jgi:hypothetical protein
MAFSIRIVRKSDPVLDCQIHIPLLVTGSRGTLGHPFRLDTGCGITIVSEPVARAMGLDARGRTFQSVFVLTGGGRIVPARFRFPFDPITGAPGREVASEWLVIPVRYEYARLGFRDVHPHFDIATNAREMHFTERA